MVRTLGLHWRDSGSAPGQGPESPNPRPNPRPNPTPSPSHKPHGMAPQKKEIKRKVCSTKAHLIKCYLQLPNDIPNTGSFMS